MPYFSRHWTSSVAVALATLLLFQSAGWFLTCGILQLEAKTAAHIALNRRETPLQCVTLSLEVLSKIYVGKKEIRYEGRLYDIKSRKTMGDSVALTLYHDRHEEAVLDALGSLITPDRNAQTLPLQNWLAKWLGTAFLLPPTVRMPVLEAVFPLHFFTCCLPAAQAEPGCVSPPPEQK